MTPPDDDTTMFHVSGSHTLRHRPQLCVIHLLVQCESPVSAADASAKLASASRDLLSFVKPLAPPDAGAQGSTTTADPDLTGAMDELDQEIAAAADTWPVRFPQYPATAWSTQNLSSWSFTPYKEKRLKYGTRTAVDVTFHEWTALAKFAHQAMVIPNVTYSGLTWRLSRPTMLALAARVRQEALREAITKAKAYASVTQPGNEDRLRIVEVVEQDDGDGRIPGGGYATRCRPSASLSLFSIASKAQATAPKPDNLEFNPEPLSVTATVSVKCSLRR